MTGNASKNLVFSEEPVSQWIEQLSGADPLAAQRLWEHFCQRLMNYARGRLKAATRRVYDEEDAAVKADYAARRQQARNSPSGLGFVPNRQSALEVNEAERSESVV